MPAFTARLMALDLNTATAILNRDQQRAQPRLPAYHLASIQVRGTAHPRSEHAPLWDISHLGISFLFNRRLQPGDVVDVQFGHRLVCQRVATVVHAIPKQESWLVGCTLDQPLSSRELAALAD